jgi:hypothetical protein
MRSGVARRGYYEDGKVIENDEIREGQPIRCESTSEDELAPNCDVPRPSIEPESGSLLRVQIQG